ncbi:MAG TPA: prevent-host-death protein [Clostridiales bacterium]|nr:prevent-host-death protein [Clostridiales bacterium]
MLVNATDLKNNLGKYLREAMREEIIIVSNGRRVARLNGYKEYEFAEETALMLQERAEAYAAYPRKATYEEYLALTEKSQERYEYIDGEIYYLASPRTGHQTALGELYYLFAAWFRGKDCKPMLAPYDITLHRNAANINVVQPDLMVICDLQEHLNERGYYMGVPSLVVEILSDSTRGKDSIKKMDLYLATGVREYWIVNPFSQEITIYRFNEGELVESRSFHTGDVAASFTFEGLKVEVDSVFA